jgi:predicted transcriptional regulator
MPHDRRVHDVMGHERAVVSWSDTADAALGRMRGLGRERLAVIDPHGVIGICERSVLLAHERRGTWLGALAVADLSRRGPFWCREDDPLDKVEATMDRLGTDLLGVLDRYGDVVGTIHRSQLARTTEPTVVEELELRL